MKKFSVKELVFIALIVTMVLVLGYVLLPIMQLMPLPALRALVVAPIYGIAVTLVLSKVKRLGTVSLLGLLIGLLLSTFFIGMLLISALGGVMTDIICGVIFKEYRSQRSISIAAGMFPALQVPLAFITLAYILGGNSGEILASPITLMIPTIITFILGYIAARSIQKIWVTRGLQHT